MFTEQPLKGAKAYYLRTVLHDWPDKAAAGACPCSGGYDMLNIFAALKRTEKQWVDLLERAGFRVVKIWRADYDGVGSNAVFEAVACQL